MSLVSTLAILLPLLFAALFTSLDTAFIAANQLHIEFLDRRGIYSGRILLKFVKNPAGFIGTTLVGHVLALTFYAVGATQLLYPRLTAYLLPPYNYPVVVVALVCFIILVGYLLVAELAPKLVFMINPDRFLQFFSVPMRLLYLLLYPLTATMAYLSGWVVRHVLRLPDAEKTALFNLTDLRHYLGALGPEPDDKTEAPEVDTRIFNNALQFKSVRARDCMVPRTEITSVDEASSISELRRSFVRSGHSKVVVYRDKIDNVVGYCHAFSLFRKPKDIASITEPLPVVAETTPISELFLQFTKDRKSLALVVDEFGGTSGLISLEDVVERIFGEIQDEYDQSEDWVEDKINEHTYLFSARHDIYYLNQKYNLELPEGEYETLGGLLFSVYQDLPPVNTHLVVGRFAFTILAVHNARIELVKVVVNRLGS